MGCDDNGCFVCCLFNDAVSISDYIASNGRMNNELERIRKEWLRSNFRYCTRNLHGGTGENHERFQSKEILSGPRFQLGTSRI
jgi:hypothetical protein